MRRMKTAKHPFPAGEAPKYARAFKFRRRGCLTGEGPQKSRNIIKVMGRIGADAEITPEEQVPPEGLAQIEVPFAFPESVHCLRSAEREAYGRATLPAISSCARTDSAIRWI